MIRTYLSELIVLLLVLWLVGWSLVKLWFAVRRESSRERAELTEARREAEAMIQDLEDTLHQVKSRHSGGHNREEK